MPKVLLPVAALAMLVGSARVSTVGLRRVFVVSKPAPRFGSRSAALLYAAALRPIPLSVEFGVLHSRCLRPGEQTPIPVRVENGAKIVGELHRQVRPVAESRGSRVAAAANCSMPRCCFGRFMRDFLRNPLPFVQAAAEQEGQVARIARFAGTRSHPARLRHASIA